MTQENIGAYYGGTRGTMPTSKCVGNTANTRTAMRATDQEPMKERTGLRIAKRTGNPWERNAGGLTHR